MTQGKTHLKFNLKNNSKMTAYVWAISPYEYKGGLEKAILSNRTLLDEYNDAFCKTHPWLAQKVTTRSAHAAVSKVRADALLAKALNI